MAFIDQWREQLPDSLTACREAIKAAGTAVAGIDPKYGRVRCWITLVST